MTELSFHVNVHEYSFDSRKGKDDAAMENRPDAGERPYSMSSARPAVLDGTQDACKSKAAKRLGLTRTQLYGRLRKYGLETPGS